MKRDGVTRVCLVVASTAKPGGQAVQAVRLQKELAREPGLAADILPIDPRLPGLLGRLQRIKYVRTIVTGIAYLISLLARLWRYDVIHVYAASYLSFLLSPTPAVLIAKLYRKPVILNYHSGEAEDHLRRWRRTALPVLRMADRVIVPSPYLVGIFAKFGISAEAIANTVETECFRFQERRRLRPWLLSNRSLEPHYNVEAALRAFAIIEREREGARLIVAGDGSERSRLHALAEEMGLKGIDFIGAVSPDQMPSVYERADIFINASLIDNAPLSILEAFSCGLAVVTTGAGGIPHIVANERNGLLVAWEGHDVLARAVQHLLDSPALAARLIETARTDVTRYTWESVRPAWVGLYLSLADKPRHYARKADSAPVDPNYVRK